MQVYIIILMQGFLTWNICKTLAKRYGIDTDINDRIIKYLTLSEKCSKCIFVEVRFQVHLIYFVNTYKVLVWKFLPKKLFYQGICNSMKNCLIMCWKYFHYESRKYQLYVILGNVSFLFSSFNVKIKRLSLDCSTNSLVIDVYLVK